MLPGLRAGAAYQARMPLAIWGVVLVATFYGSLAFVAAMLLWPAARASLTPALVSVIAWILAGVVLNALYCGVLSGPHDRYATRVQWLLPLTAMLILAHLLTRHDRARNSPPPRPSSPVALSPPCHRQRSGSYGVARSAVRLSLVARIALACAHAPDSVSCTQAA